MHQITITFCSKPDQEDALRQINKAREYAGKGRQLGALGLSILLKTIERAKSIETQDHAELIYCAKGLLRDTDRKMNVKKDYHLMVHREGLKKEIEKLETTTKKKTV